MQVPLVGRLHWSKLVAGKHMSQPEYLTATEMCVRDPWLKTSIVVHLDLPSASKLAYLF